MPVEHPEGVGVEAVLVVQDPTVGPAKVVRRQYPRAVPLCLSVDSSRELSRARRQALSVYQSHG